jgi:hypothetical protein
MNSNVAMDLQRNTRDAEGYEYGSVQQKLS